MEIIEIVIHKVGDLAYSLPSAFLVLLIKEFTRISFFKKTGTDHSKSIYFNPVSSIDPFALFCLSLTNISWGGLVQKNRKDNWLSFLISSLSLLLLMIIIMGYLSLKNPDKTTYLYLLCHSMIKQSWLVFLINCLPIPPFDMSFFYTQKIYMYPINFFFKIIFVTLLLSGLFNIQEYIPNFLSKFLLQ